MNCSHNLVVDSEGHIWPVTEETDPLSFSYGSSTADTLQLRNTPISPPPTTLGGLRKDALHMASLESQEDSDEENGDSKTVLLPPLESLQKTKSINHGRADLRLQRLIEAKILPHVVPTFIYGCRVCTGCRFSNAPHLHKEKAAKAGGGFTYMRRDVAKYGFATELGAAPVIPIPEWIMEDVKRWATDFLAVLKEQYPPRQLEVILQSNKLNFFNPAPATSVILRKPLKNTSENRDPRQPIHKVMFGKCWETPPSASGVLNHNEGAPSLAVSVPSPHEQIVLRRSEENVSPRQSLNLSSLQSLNEVDATLTSNTFPASTSSKAHLQRAQVFHPYVLMSDTTPLQREGFVGCKVRRTAEIQRQQRRSTVSLASEERSVVPPLPYPSGHLHQILQQPPPASLYNSYDPRLAFDFLYEEEHQRILHRLSLDAMVGLNRQPVKMPFMPVADAAVKVDENRVPFRLPQINKGTTQYDELVQQSDAFPDSSAEGNNFSQQSGTFRSSLKSNNATTLPPISQGNVSTGRRAHQPSPTVGLRSSYRDKSNRNARIAQLRREISSLSPQRKAIPEEDEDEGTPETADLGGNEMQDDTQSVGLHYSAESSRQKSFNTSSPAVADRQDSRILRKSSTMSNPAGPPEILISSLGKTHVATSLRPSTPPQVPTEETHTMIDTNVHTKTVEEETSTQSATYEPPAAESQEPDEPEHVPETAEPVTSILKKTPNKPDPINKIIVRAPPKRRVMIPLLGKDTPETSPDLTSEDSTLTGLRMKEKSVSFNIVSDESPDGEMSFVREPSVSTDESTAEEVIPPEPEVPRTPPEQRREARRQQLARLAKKPRKTVGDPSMRSQLVLHTENSQDGRDPLDYLSKYCIFVPHRVPVYENTFKCIIEMQTEEDDGTPREAHEDASEQGAFSEQGGNRREVPVKQKKKKKKSKKKGSKGATSTKPSDLLWPIVEEKNVKRKAQVDPTSFTYAPGKNIAEKNLSKVLYKIQFVTEEVNALRAMKEEAANEMENMMLNIIKHEFPELLQKTPGSRTNKKGKKRVHFTALPPSLGRSELLSMVNPKLLRVLQSLPSVRLFKERLELAETQEKQLLAHRAGLEKEAQQWRNFVDELHAKEAVNNVPPEALCREQSMLYQTLHPLHKDVEMNVEFVEMALQSINSLLLSEKELQYIYYILDLPSKPRVNMQMFSCIAALSEKVSKLEPFTRKLINKMDFEALDWKINKCKELFYLLDEDDISTPRGTAPVSSLLVEFTAGGLATSVVDKIMHKFDRENKGYVEFLDFLTYVPLFVELHENIVKDPLSVQHTAFEWEDNEMTDGSSREHPGHERDN